MEPLMSQRYVPVAVGDYHPSSSSSSSTSSARGRSRHINILGNIVLHQSRTPPPTSPRTESSSSPSTHIQPQHPTSSPSSTSPSTPLTLYNNNTTQSLAHSTQTEDTQLSPFPFLSLPLELRRQIYINTFTNNNHPQKWDITLDLERVTMLRTKFIVKGVPSMSLLLTSRQLYAETHDLRLQLFSGRLILNSVFILVPLRKKARFDWLRSNVRTLHFSDSSVHPERWNRYYDSFEGLKKLEIEFPSVVRLDSRCKVLKEVLGGERDDVLLETLDYFRLALVDQLSGFLQVVVGQRYCLKEDDGNEEADWRGIVHVQIELSSEGIKILRRDHEEGVDVISKRQFRRT